MARRDSGPDQPRSEGLAARPDFPKVADPQVVLAKVNVNENDDVEVPVETVFVACPSPGEARQEANARSAAEPGSRYAVYDAAGRLLVVLDAPAEQAAS